jgi:ferredoxin-thioredoxin reductase catalytic subunit
MGNSWDEVIGKPEYDDNLRRLGEIAVAKGYELNPDRARLEKVVGLMTMNNMKFDKYYCPCKQSHPLNPETDLTCPCSTIDQEVAQEGHCFCKLFFREQE